MGSNDGECCEAAFCRSGALGRHGGRDYCGFHLDHARENFVVHWDEPGHDELVALEEALDPIFDIMDARGQPDDKLVDAAQAALKALREALNGEGDGYA